MGRIGQSLVVAVVLVWQLVAYYNGGGGTGRNLVKAASIDNSSILANIYTLCNTQKYDNGSAFSRDLNRALSTLQQRAKTLAYNLQNAGTVMTAYQCRGDLPPDTCSSCVTQAIQSALSDCPNAIGSRVQLAGCFVRYENVNFTVLDTNLVVQLCNTQKDNSSTFESRVTNILRDVITAAPQDTRRYASARFILNTSNATSSLYALAQCLGYLSPAQCSDCLAAHSSSWKNCGSVLGAQIHSVSCYYRFETYPFYYEN